MTSYFVDYENVNKFGVEQAGKLAKPGDRIYIFFTGENDVMPMKHMADFSGEVHFYKVPMGNESLDFNLLLRLGALLGENSAENACVIVSNDKGYDYILPLCSKLGFSVKRTPVNTDVKNKSAQTVTKREPENQQESENSVLNRKLTNLLNEMDITNEQIGQVSHHAIKHKREKQLVYRWIVHTFGQKKGLLIYRTIANVVWPAANKSA